MTPGPYDDLSLPRPPSLSALGRTVRHARQEVHECRHAVGTTRDLADARRALISALQNYTVALEEQHLPVPSALRAELKMHRDLFEW
jgi:hypothetical protein